MHSTKRPDGLYKVHVDSTNLTVNIATICPEVSAVQKACVAVIFNEDMSLLLSSNQVDFGDSLSPDVHLVTVVPSQFSAVA